MFRSAVAVIASTVPIGGDGDPFADPAVINELVRHNSEHTCLAFLPLPTLPPHTASVQEDEVKRPPPPALPLCALMPSCLRRMPSEWRS